MTQVVGSEDDVCRFDGDVGSAGAHREPHVGNGECGSVVDAVADHGHAMALAAHFLNEIELFLRQQTESIFRDIGNLRRSLRNGFTVTSEHDESSDPYLTQTAHHFPRFGPYRSGETDDTDNLPAMSDKYCGLRWRNHVRTDVSHRNLVFGHHSGTARDDLFITLPNTNAKAGEDLVFIAPRDVARGAAGVPNNGDGEWML